MKLIHLSDLHLGKRIYEYSMIEDQAFILDRITDIIDSERADGVIIAGDVYDKATPSAEAVGLFDCFLSSLAKRSIPVFVISGNHDSPERIAFGSQIMSEQRVYMSPVYGGSVEPVTLTDAYGEVDVWLLPFIKPANVRRFFENGLTDSYTDALRTAIDAMPVDRSRRNVLVTHQLVTGSTRSDSEEISVGGTDNVDASVFESFDYVALGHIHSPQSCGSPVIRYCGTPLKYSFSEAKDNKSVTVIELGKKGNVSYRTVPLTPLHDMVELKGTYDEVMFKGFYDGTTWGDDYTHITLTDETDIPDAVARLRTVYHRLMHLDYDNTRTRTDAVTEQGAQVQSRSPLELFGDFFELQNGRPMSEEQRSFIGNRIEKIWEDR